MTALYIPTDYPTLIKNVLSDYAPPAGESLQAYTLFDDPGGNYALIEAGWEKDRYLHHTIIHVGYKDGKIRVYCDNTEEGVATAFVEAGVPKTHIVLDFRPVELRQYTGFAVA